MFFLIPSIASIPVNILHSIAELSSLSGPIIFVCGTFDGVHLGHQALIRRAQKEAAACGGRVVVMTFNQHPAALLRPEQAPRLLTTTAEKLKLLEALGVDTVLLLTFDEVLAATSAAEFIQQLVSAANQIKAICVGAAWSFGQGGKGNITLLQQLGKKFNFSVITIDPIKVAGTGVSSTRIRNALAQGHLEEAAACLGRRYVLTGRVVHGAGRGKTLGFPTANLAIGLAQLPLDGVYGVKAHVAGIFHRGIANIGRRPTVDLADAPRIVEVHLFDFEGDLYDQEITIELLSYIRGEQKFSSLDELRNQIQRDIATIT